MQKNPCRKRYQAFIRHTIQTAGKRNLSGHYYFKHNYFCDSGFIAAIILIEVLQKLNLAFSKIVGSVNLYYLVGILLPSCMWDLPLPVFKHRCYP